MMDDASCDEDEIGSNMSRTSFVRSESKIAAGIDGRRPMGSKQRVSEEDFCMSLKV